MQDWGGGEIASGLIDPNGHGPQKNDEVPPVITIDDEKGFCVNIDNSYNCSGTWKSNMEWMKWNACMLPYEIFQRRAYNSLWWNDVSTVLTDAAFATSSIGATVEMGYTAAGFVLGDSFGPVGGAVGGSAGWILGNGTYQVIFNPVESAFSTFSTGSSIASDFTSNKTYITLKNEELSIGVGESTATAMITQGVGNQIPIGVIDAAIDGYASSFAHGLSNGVLKITGIGGQSLHLGPITINFGR